MANPKDIVAFHLLFASLLVITSCSGESCRIDFNKNPEMYQKAILDISNLNMRTTSNQPYSRIIKTIKRSDNLVDEAIFEHVEFIECHADSTVIFQAPNCTKGSGFKDDIFVLIYAPKGETHINRKRNIRGLKRISENWFQGFHVISLAN